MKHLVKFILLTASRDRLFIATLLMLLVTICLGAILGSTSVIEQSQTMSAIVAGSSAYIVIFGIIVFICFHIKNSYENKEVELFLTKPITRMRFLASYIVGYLVVALMIVSALTVILISLKSIGLFFGKTADYLFWASTLYLEVALISIFAVFASLILKSAVTSVLATIGFYIFSKIIGVMMVIINNPFAVGVSDSIGWYAKKILWVLAFVFPRLDLFAKTEWLIYGFDSVGYGIASLLFTSVVYGAVIFGMMVYDFNRQEF